MPTTAENIMSGLTPQSSPKRYIFGRLRGLPSEESQQDYINWLRQQENFKTAEALRQKSISDEANQAESRQMDDLQRALPKEEVIPGVPRPAYTTAAMELARAKSAGLVGAANQFDENMGERPMSQEIGNTGAKAKIASNMFTTAKMDSDRGNIPFMADADKTRAINSARVYSAQNRLGVPDSIARRMLLENTDISRGLEARMASSPYATEAGAAATTAEINRRRNEAMLKSGAPERSVELQNKMNELKMLETQNGMVDAETEKKFQPLRAELSEAMMNSQISSTQLQRALSEVNRGVLGQPVNDPMVQKILEQIPPEDRKNMMDYMFHIWRYSAPKESLADIIAAARGGTMTDINGKKPLTTAVSSDSRPVLRNNDGW